MNDNIKYATSKQLKRALKCPLIFLFLLLIMSSFSSAAKKPNIVFVLADDLGYMDLVSYATSVKKVSPEECYYETPHIDKLIKKSVKFTQAYASPLCSPTRSSLITGTYAATQGFMTATPGMYQTHYNQGKTAPQGFSSHDGFYQHTDRAQWPLTQGISNIALRKDSLTIAEALEDYHSAFVGKWHLGGHGSKGYSPMDQGFEGIAWFDAGGSPYFNWRKRWNKKTLIHKKMSQDTLYSGDAGKETGEKYLTDDLTVQACEFIQGRQKEKQPFFLYFCHFAVHSPFQAKPQDIRYFSKKKQRGWNGHANPTYASMLKSLDDSIGAMVATLKATKQLDNTIIIFMSDNGGIVHPDENGKPGISNNHPLKGEKALLYEGGIRVPLFISYPKDFTPASCDVALDCNDIFPTILDMAALSKKSYEKYGAGTSLLPLLKDKKHSQEKYPRDEFYWHYPFYVAVALKKGELTAPSSALRKGDYKLILNWEKGVELYNIKKDLSEKSDLAKKNPELAKAMFVQLAKWLDDNVESRYLPIVNPRYNPRVKIARPYVDPFALYGVKRPSGCASRIN